MMASTNTETSDKQPTESDSGDERTSEATVIDMKDVSSTVKYLRLQIHNKNMSFKAGQWLDFYMPGTKTVGGFSMCSSPHTLVEKGTLDLAVKFSDHPVVMWVHTQCKIGTKVKVRVGDQFSLLLDESHAIPKPIILIAAGVGANPLLSILLYAAKCDRTRRITFMYSAKTIDDILFQDVLRKVTEENKSTIRIQLFVSRGQIPDNKCLGDISIKAGRITRDDVLSVVGQYGNDIRDIHGYICGPSPMIDEFEIYLNEGGLAKDNIHYEKWW